MADPTTVDWRSLIRTPLRDVGPYVPGASAAEARARYGVAELARLNWNEGLLGPLPGVLEETAERLADAWAYPDAAYEELRDALATWLDAPRERVLPGHGIQALVLTVVSALVSAGDHVVVPRPTYGLYAPACQAAGATVHRVDSPGLAMDVERIAATARATRARLVWVCDPNNPTGARLDAADWAQLLDALPPGCVAVADEAYVDYVPPPARAPRLADVAAGRPVVVLPPVSTLSTEALGREWVRTTTALAGPLDAGTREAIVVRRQQTLDELERRDPDGFARWLSGVPLPGSDPSGDLRHGDAAA